MQKIIDLVLSPKQASDELIYRSVIAKQLNVKDGRISAIRILKKSIDARQRQIKVQMRVNVFVDENPSFEKDSELKIKAVDNAEPVLVIGSGPAGLFAAIQLIELGFKPLVFERGADVSQRKRDVAQINRTKKIISESNYSFGEGGAGTFSDGKLYTRSKKRGSVERILSILHQHGAHENILYDAHPHIGTDKLPAIIKRIRETIISAGGEFYFSTKMIDIIVQENKVKGIVTEKGDKIFGQAVVLATGHSARDVYEFLHNKGLQIEAKPFAMGLRVEHPQAIIDTIQYHCDIRSKFLPSATYNLVEQVNGRGVYSFCMCPGGFIVPAATHDNETVVNGMSPSHRNSPFANSGMVVELKMEDFSEFNQYGPLAGLKYQQQLEKMAFNNGGDGQIAPAQRLDDFVRGKISQGLPPTSYIPGIVSSPMHFWLPSIISQSLREGFKIFGKKMPGYLTNEAIVVGVESRTSSPVKIPRDEETLMHPQLDGLFPCGEGAGFSGGIVSSAMDGEKVAIKVSDYLRSSI
jgi:uncharacterized FAD-dependent dehydrogenase